MSDYISKSRLLNSMAGVHYDTEHPLESYTALVSLINNAPTEEIEDASPDERVTAENEKLRDLAEKTIKASLNMIRAIFELLDPDNI